MQIPLYTDTFHLERDYLQQMYQLSCYDADKFLINEDRTGEPTYRSPSPFSFAFSLKDNKGKLLLPLMMGRRTPLRGVLAELLWFLSGSRSKKDIVQKFKFPVWGEWGKPDQDDMGPVYGHQWRTWGATDEDPQGFDQITNVIDSIKKDLFSRRHVVSTWNPKELNTMWVALPPCHGLSIQFVVLKDALGVPELHSRVYMRSTDLPVGGVANMIMYSILTHLMAHELNLLPGTVSFFMALPHVYKNQVPALKEWIESFYSVTKLNSCYIEFGTKEWSLKDKNLLIEDFSFYPDDDRDSSQYVFKLLKYEPNKSISFPVSI